LRALGLRLADGSDFSPEEYVPMEVANGYTGQEKVGSAILSKALAARFFPDGQAVGRYIYDSNSNRAVRVVGVLENLARPILKGAGSDQETIFLPMQPDSPVFYFVMHVGEAGRDVALRSARTRLMQLDRNRMLTDVQSYEQLRADYFRRDRDMLNQLLAAGGALLLVTSLGMTGLVSFWVQQRRRQIGIRRALGATGRDVLWFFLAENSALVLVGVVLGAVFAYAINAFLITHYGAPVLPSYYLPIGAAMLWGISQMSVLGPAWRAARIAPMNAMRLW
jgi:putative ABC transport system permease protein